MEQAKFEALVARMEQIAADRPTAYRRRVFALAALGYAYLLLVVLVLAAACVLAVASIYYLKALAVKLLFAVAALLVIVLRSLRVKLEPPQGERLTRADAPRLFQLLDELQKILRTPPIHQVLMTPEFNAGVMQLPRLGLFGWHKNYLVLGLPLVESLTIVQFKAVIAHELGHLSRGHARAGNWIYRLRLIWARLERALQDKPRWGSGAIRAFFRWYIPYFHATSFPLARANEYEADAASVRQTSAQSVAQALTSVHVVGSYLERKYWPGIHSAARDSSQPAFAPYSGFAIGALGAVPADELRTWQEGALARKTSYADTHPSLGDRLKAIGAPAEFAPPAAGEAADQLVAGAVSRIARTFDERWRTGIAESWRKFHENVQKQRARLQELRSTTEQSALDVEKALELARLEEAVGAGASAALAMRRGMVTRFPDSLPVRFALGRQLLGADDPEGLALIEHVMGRDENAVAAGAELLRDYYWKNGDHVLARHWHDRHVERVGFLKAAAKERETLTLADRIAGHMLDAEALASLVGQLKTVAGVKHAYLVRKLVQHRSDVPMYILGFGSTAFMHRYNHERAKAAVQAIKDQVTFPGQTLIVNIEGANARFAKKLKGEPGARIL